MDYQDWSIPEFWPYELDETRSEEKEHNEDPTVQELGHLDKTKYDKVSDKKDNMDDKEVSKDKEGESVNPEKQDESDEDDDDSGNRTRKPSDESHEKSDERESEKNDKEAGGYHEMVIAKALDLNIRNYKTDDWLVYW